ncbi:MAG: hypothetical protein JST54_26415 [Deltaproteobacteria bacterium]|nr:hypothetical protein [Deltaproteobacteria bacterium]
MRRAAWLGLLMTLAGCMGGPKEAELTLDIGPSVVTLDARLRDIRVNTADEAPQAETIVRFISAEEAKKTFGDAAANMTATTWAWTFHDDVADLHITGTMPRDKFDACVTERPATGYEPPLPCELVPLWKEKGEIVSALDDPKGDASELELHGPTRWPAGATHLATSWTWKQAFPTRVTKVLQRVQKDPAGYSQGLARAMDYAQALQDGDAAKARKLVTDAPLKGDARAWLFELANRERLSLLQGFLESQQLGPELVSPGQSTLLSAWQVYWKVVPKGSVPREPLLELALLYDRAAAEPMRMLAWRSELQPGTSDWERANQDVHVSFSETELAAQCTKAAKGRAAFKKLCALLSDSKP